MSKYFLETPFDNWLIFNTDKTKIESVGFCDRKAGLPIAGLIKDLMYNVFSRKDLSLFDYSIINFNTSNRSYRLYTLLIGTKTGETLCYSDTAFKLFGSKNYARAVGKMLNTNPFAFLVPCHRIVAKNGIGGYASGANLKKRILSWENAVLNF